MSAPALTVYKNSDLSASGMQRVERCPGFRHLPWTMSSNFGSRRGSEFGQFIDEAIEHGFKGAFARLTDETAKALAKGFNFRQLFDLLETEKPLREVAYAYNVETDTGRLLGDHLNRDYGVSFPEIPGSLDLIGIHRNPDRLIIVDIKTGQTNVPEPALNWQLGTLALATSRHYGIYDVTTYIVKAIDGGHPVIPPPARYDFMGLDILAGKMRKMLKGNKIVAGEHCKYCPAFNACPVQSQNAQALIEMTKRGKMLTPTVIAELYERMMAAQNAVYIAKDLITEYVKAQGQVPMGDGRVLHIKTVETKKLKPKIAFNVIKELVGLETAEKISKVSKSAIFNEVPRSQYNTIIKTIAARGGMVLSERNTLEAVSEDKAREAKAK